MTTDKLCTIKVHASTRDELMHLRDASHLDTLESVIRWLLGDVALPERKRKGNRLFDDSDRLFE